MNRSHGFTLIELILVIVILGIVSIYAAPRMKANLFDARVAAQELVEAIRYAQTLSMNSSGSDHYQIEITSSGYRLSKNDSDIVNPLTGSAPYEGSVPTNLATTTVRFDSRGRPFDGNDNPLTMPLIIAVSAGGETVTVRLEPLTGYARID